MKKTIIFAILCIIGMGTVSSQTDEDRKSSFQFTFLTPLGTNGKYSSQYTNDYSVNLLVGVSKNENKFAFAGLGNVILNNAGGVQLAGFFNYIGNDANGVQLAGFANYIGNNGSGVALSGFLNRSKTYNGIQISGFANIANDVNGIQISGFANKSDNLNGFQITGFGNISKQVNGFQIAGFANIANDVNGFQIAGFVNRAKHVNGFQVAGFLNIADHNDYPLGLVNIIKDGEYSIGVSYNEIGSTLLSFRSGGRVLYGIVGAGYNHKAVDGAFATQAGVGAHANISPKFRINTELKGEFITSFSDDETYKQGLSVMPAYKFSPHFEIFGGPSINYMHSKDMEHRDLFPSGRIWRKFSDSKLQQVYVGFEIGTQVVF